MDFISVRSIKKCVSSVCFVLYKSAMAEYFEEPSANNYQC